MRLRMRLKVFVRTNRGTIFIMALCTIASTIILLSASMNRSLTELLVVNHEVNAQQAFHMAEGGLDAALVDSRLQGPFTQSQVDQLLSNAQASSTPFLSWASPNGPLSYTVRLQDDATSGNPLALLVSTGTGASTTQQLRTTIRFNVNQAPPSLFNYAIAASNLNLSGSAMLGDAAPDGSGRVPIYIDSGGVGSSPTYALDSPASATVYAKKVDFLQGWNPSNTLDVLCHYCSNASVFPVTPGPAPIFNLQNVTQPPMPTIDFMSYYNQAVAQCVAEGYAQAYCNNPSLGCQPGYCPGNKPTSRIFDTVNTVANNFTIDGNNYPNGIEGVIYIEAGVNVTFKNNVVIKGTIVHEGVGYNQASGNLVSGTITFAANSSVSIDSTASTDINSDGTAEPAFAPGLAVLGGPILNWKTTATIGDGSSINPGIVGFVMAGSYKSGSTVVTSQISSTGTISGGVMSVDATHLSSSAYMYDTFHGFHFAQSGPWNGPTNSISTNPLNYYIMLKYGPQPLLNLGGNSHVMFKPLPGGLPGFTASNGSPYVGSGGGSSGSAKPSLLLWAPYSS